MIINRFITIRRLKDARQVHRFDETLSKVPRIPEGVQPEGSRTI